MLKSVGKLGATQLKEFLACKKAGLKAGTIDSTGDLAACFDQLLADPKGKIGKEEAKLASTLGKSCTEKGVALATASPGACTVGTRPFAECVEQRVRCHACLMLDTADGLDRLCDAFDDGLADNASCGDPLLFEETISVPNGVQPDETPGSPGVVVTNPKLLTQFGGGSFSLNDSATRAGACTARCRLRTPS